MTSKQGFMFALRHLPSPPSLTRLLGAQTDPGVPRGYRVQGEAVRDRASSAGRAATGRESIVRAAGLACICGGGARFGCSATAMASAPARNTDRSQRGYRSRRSRGSRGWQLREVVATATQIRRFRVSWQGACPPGVSAVLPLSLLGAAWCRRQDVSSLICGPPVGGFTGHLSLTKLT